METASDPWTVTAAGLAMRTGTILAELALLARPALPEVVSEVSELAMTQGTLPRALAAERAGTRPGLEVLDLGGAPGLPATRLTSLMTAPTDFPVGPPGIAT